MKAKKIIEGFFDFFLLITIIYLYIFPTFLVFYLLFTKNTNDKILFIGSIINMVLFFIIIYLIRKSW